MLIEESLACTISTGVKFLAPADFSLEFATLLAEVVEFATYRSAFVEVSVIFLLGI